jgi:hypothetical protein
LVGFAKAWPQDQSWKTDPNLDYAVLLEILRIEQFRVAHRHGVHVVEYAALLAHRLEDGIGACLGDGEIVPRVTVRVGISAANKFQRMLVTSAKCSAMKCSARETP